MHFHHLLRNTTYASVFFISTCFAQLPSLSDQEWANYFLAIETREFKFGITSKGEETFHPLNKSGKIQSVYTPVKFNIEILEIDPDGKTVSKQIREDSLETNDSAILNPRIPVTYRGKVTGDAAFQVTFTPERDGFGVAGKITDQGDLKHQLKLVVSIGFDPYRKLSNPDKSELKTFESRTRRDHLKVNVSFSEKDKFDLDEKVNLQEKFPDGAESLSYRADGYDSIDFGLRAHGNSKLTFPDGEELMIGNGVNVQWTTQGTEQTDEDKLVVTAK